MNEMIVKSGSMVHKVYVLSAGGQSESPEPVPQSIVVGRDAKVEGFEVGISVIGLH